MMMKIMKLIKKCVSILGICATVFAAFAVPKMEAKAETPVYTIEFRGGNHGTFAGQTNVKQFRQYKETVTSVPEPDTIDNGYWFTGYSTEVETTVTESKVYVAQYARLIDSVEYRINYVDASGVSLATQRVAYANRGDTITAYAADVAGYMTDTMVKNVTAQGNSVTITFVYNVAGAEEEAAVQPVEPENPAAPEAAIVPAAQGAAVNPAEPAALAAVADADDGLVTIDDLPVPQGNVDTNDEAAGKEDEAIDILPEDVALADIKLEHTPVWAYVAGASLLGVIAVLAVVFITRKRNMKNFIHKK